MPPRQSPTSKPHSGQGVAEHHRHHGSPWTRAQALEFLESPDRRESEDAEALWNRVALTPGSTVAEVGAGTGYYSIPAARRVGKRGKVYAIDLSEDLVKLLGERAHEQRLPQLEPVRSSEFRIPLASAIVDVVLLANVLHDIPQSTLKEAVRLMRPRGRLANVDWIKAETVHGPPIEIRLTPEEAAERFASNGLELIESWDFGPSHYAQILSNDRRA